MLSNFFMLYYLRWSLSNVLGSHSIDGCKILYNFCSLSLEIVKGSLKGPPPVLNRSLLDPLKSFLTHSYFNRKPEASLG